MFMFVAQQLTYPQIYSRNSNTIYQVPPKNWNEVSEGEREILQETKDI